MRYSSAVPRWWHVALIGGLIAIAAVLVVPWAPPSQFDRAVANMEPTGIGPDWATSEEGDRPRPMASALFASANVHDFRRTGSRASFDRAVAAAAALQSTARDTRSGRAGWGQGFRWDAFGDGSVNPANTVYGITTALAVQALLDVHEMAADATYLVLAEEALDSYAEHFTQSESGGYFWYSEWRRDARPVLNVSAMLAGQYARLGRVLDRPDYRELARSAANYILAYRRRDVPDARWPYQVGRDKPNDAVHAAYVVQGLEEVTRNAAVAGFDAEASFDHLRTFLASDGGVNEFAGGGDPARVWGVGYLMFVTCEYTRDLDAAGSLRTALDQYEIEDGAYSRLPGEEIVYPRMQAHVLIGLAACGY